MTESELQGFRDQLIRWRSELESVAGTGDDAAATVELDQTRVGRLSRMDAMQAQAMSVAAKQRRETNLRRIAAALRRLDAGQYGDCQECDEPINPRRLEIDPAATLCIQCAS